MVVVILLWTLVDGCHIFGYHTMPSCHHVLLNVTLLTVSDTLRALYLGDNDFETIPPDICKLVNLQIVSGYPSSDLVSSFHTILYLIFSLPYVTGLIMAFCPHYGLSHKLMPCELDSGAIAVTN